jgi:hypothetical protein
MSMRVSAGQPYEAHTSRTATAQCVLPAEHECFPAAGVATVWRSALAMFILRAPAILLVACICITGPAILGLLINITLGLDRFVHIGGPLATWEAIILLRSNSTGAMITALVVQIGLSAIGLVFARGVIARLALSDAVDAPSLSLVCREAKARFGSLFIGSFLYGACTTAGAVGINGILHDTRLDLRLIGQSEIITPIQTLALRALDTFVPSPGAPFVEFVPLLRHSSFAHTTRFASTVRSSGDNLHWSYISDQAQMPFVSTSTATGERRSPVLAIGLASLGVLLLAEALLRFAPVIVMTGCGRTRLGAITPMLHGIEFGIRHFGAITRQVWLLRLSFVAGYSAFFMLPAVLARDVAPPVVMNAWKPMMGIWPAMLTLMCHSFVTALFVAFSTVYDARLAMHLDPQVANR